MISIDSHENFNPWVEDEISTVDPLNSIFGGLSEHPDDDYEFYKSMELGFDLNNMELEENPLDKLNLFGLSPVKLDESNPEDYFYNLNMPSTLKIDDPTIVEKSAPLSPDSGIGQDASYSLDECADLLSSMENDEDVQDFCEPVKVTNETELNQRITFGMPSCENSNMRYLLKELFNFPEYNKYMSGAPVENNNFISSAPVEDNNILSGAAVEENNYISGAPVEVNSFAPVEDLIFNDCGLPISVTSIVDPEFNCSYSRDELESPGSLNCSYSIPGYKLSENDSIASDHWLNKSTLNPIPNDDLSAVCGGPVLPVEKEEYKPVKKECIKIKIKKKNSADLFILRKNSQTIQNEHCYHRRLGVVESDEEDIPVKKRKRDEVDEDFSPYLKPKRKAGRPRTNFSKVDSQKTQRIKTQKTKGSKRTTQASKKLKSCSSVPFDRREQHNQAERERRDMLKRNLDMVEDITPDHVLQLTQIALQSEKTCKSDEFENNENNFTVDVLKKLDELIKKEPVSHRPRYKKASRNSKMVVLLGSTYYLGSLEKELKSKENRLAQVKKQYEECLKRLNPTKVSKKMRRNY